MLITRSIRLEQVVHKTFRQILLNPRNGQVTTEDRQHLMKQIPAHVQDLTPFSAALYLHPTIDAVMEHNLSRLCANGQPIVTIKTVHTGPNASKASLDEGAGLEPIICLAHEARVTLAFNPWTDAGHVNGAMGTIKFVTRTTKLHQIYHHQLW